MKAALVYFSGTGNTKYVMQKLKKELEKNNVECHMIDVTSIDKKLYGYDFYVFGAPIHAEMYPKYFTDWVKRNIKKTFNKRCIIFSTQASEKAAGADYLGVILKKKGFKIVIKDYISMPNNYCVVTLKENKKEKIEKLKINASKKAEGLVNKFINGDKHIKKVSKVRIILGKIVYKLFSVYSKGWARKNLNVDPEICIKCQKCVKECPTHNINLIEGKITFNTDCISCQRCIHKCPVNAFKYKGKTFNQYKL